MTSNYLDKIQIKNFKNLEEKTLNFSNHINCIFGNNGNGKTNLLEAIYYLLHRKSFKKKTTFQQIINVECEKPEILFLSSLVFQDEKISVSSKILPEESYWYLNNEPKKFNSIKALVISPFDSNLFHTDSQFRRQWIDQLLSALSPRYKADLSNYKKCLKFRNSLLQKKPYRFEEQIISNDENFVKYNISLAHLREELLNELNQYCSKTFKIIFSDSHNLRLYQESSIKNLNTDQLLSLYKNELQNDILTGRTKTGVHRENFLFDFDGYNSLEYCSLGQQKMSFLSLVFAYIELFRYKLGTYPIVLMDDVSGELDRQRWLNLIKFLESKSFQVFITTANENFKEELELIERAKKFFIEDGKFSEY